MERGEGRKEIWNEGFSKLGKFDVDDKNFDREECVRTSREVEQWERESRENKSLE